MVKNGCLPDLSGIWVTKKPLKFSDFLMVDSNYLQLFTTNHLPMQKFLNMFSKTEFEDISPTISDR